MASNCTDSLELSTKNWYRFDKFYQLYEKFWIFNIYKTVQV